ncbi:hypothetical protein ACFLZV_03975 [Candidatus Margulisiibacteriota bacterium]
MPVGPIGQINNVLPQMPISAANNFKPPPTPGSQINYFYIFEPISPLLFVLGAAEDSKDAYNLKDKEKRQKDIHNTKKNKKYFFGSG